MLLTKIVLSLRHLIDYGYSDLFGRNQAYRSYGT